MTTEPNAPAAPTRRDFLAEAVSDLQEDVIRGGEMHAMTANLIGRLRSDLDAMQTENEALRQRTAEQQYERLRFDSAILAELALLHRGAARAEDLVEQVKEMASSLVRNSEQTGAWTARILEVCETESRRVATARTGDHQGKAIADQESLRLRSEVDALRRDVARMDKMMSVIFEFLERRANATG